MPMGLLGTLAIGTVLYVGVCLVVTGMVHYSKLSEGDAVADVFTQNGLGWAGILIGIAAVAGLSSVILVDIVAMGRIGFALSRDGLLPPIFSCIHPRRRSAQDLAGHEAPIPDPLGAHPAHRLCHGLPGLMASLAVETWQ
ncbi:hypothetical protein GCM10009689_23750 [Brevibacterium antiquum]